MKPDNRVTVLVVDDHPVMVEGLTYRLESTGRYRVVATAKSSAECLVEYALNNPDLVTCDVGLGRDSGMTLITDLLEHHPEAKILMYTARDDINLAQDAVALGAVGYVRKDATSTDFTECLAAAVNGERGVFDRFTLQAMLSAKFTPNPDGLPRITGRERDVLRLIASGTSRSKDIAEELFISEKSVRTHIERLNDKLNTRNRVQLALEAGKVLEALEQAERRPNW